MNNKVLFWLLTCFLITLFSGLIYASVQQSLRLSANDPQIQIVNDITSSLNQGADPRQLSATAIDLKTSLSPFVTIYDKSGKVIASTGELGGKTPELPKGVFDFVNKHGEERLSWEPAKGVREAAVVGKYKNGYVLAAKSLKETEAREDVILRLSGVAWVIGIGVASVVFFAQQLMSKLPVKLPLRLSPQPSPRKKAKK